METKHYSQITAGEAESLGFESDKAIAFYRVALGDGIDAVYAENADGSFWTQVSNEDEIFTDRNACHEWLADRMARPVLKDEYITVIERRISNGMTQLYSLNVEDGVITAEYALVNELNGEYSLEDSLVCPDMRSALECLQNWAAS
jgi:hypothetical protein